jgi:Uma2 family endonuclease
MAIRDTPEIDFSTFPESDGEPMAETVENMIQMTNLIYALRVLLETQGHTRVAVGGNQFLYYNPHNGRDHVSPDVYVALDVEPGNRPTWKTWLEGKCPDVVFEISSPSTRDQDLGFKRDLYARLGAKEYYIYDPQQAMEPPFVGYALRGGRLERRAALPGGGIRSPLLGAELRQVGIYLRVIDPATDEPFPEPDEERRDRLIAENRALVAEDRVLAAVEEARAAAAHARAAAEQVSLMVAQIHTAQEQVRTAQEQARAAEQRATTAEQRAIDAEEGVVEQARARIEAEERARQAEAALREALAELARRQQSATDQDTE